MGLCTTNDEFLRDKKNNYLLFYIFVAKMFIRIAYYGTKEHHIRRD